MVFEHTVLIVTKLDPASSNCLHDALAPFQDPYATLNFEYCKEYSIFKNILSLKEKLFDIGSGCLIPLTKRKFGNSVGVVPFSGRDSASSAVTVLVADDQPNRVIDIIVFDNPHKRWSEWNMAGEPCDLLLTKQGESPICLVSDLDIENARRKITVEVTENYHYLQSILPIKNKSWKRWVDIAKDYKSKNIPVADSYKDYLNQDVIKYAKERDYKNRFFGGGALNIDEYLGDLDYVLGQHLQSLFMKKSILDARDIENPKWIDCCKNGENTINFQEFIDQLEPDEYIAVVNCRCDNF